MEENNQIFHAEKDARFINEHTPNSKSSFKQLPTFSTQMKETMNEELLSPALDCVNQMNQAPISHTPKTPLLDPADGNDFSITNPFESYNTIDSLLHPSFSPSVFVTNGSSNSETQKTPNNFWSIDQFAVMNPIDIDLSLLHKQEEFVRFDTATEKKAQEAIERFFTSHIDMPSPWSSERSSSHYLALISPSPAHLKKMNLRTPGAGHAGCSSSSTTSSLSSSSQIRVRKFNFNSGKRTANNQVYKKTIPENSRDIKGSSTAEKSPKFLNASTQTTLTLPASVDLEKIISQYYTYQEDIQFEKNKDSQCEALSNSSLRRKLFFPEGEENKIADKEEVDPSPLEHVDEMENLSPFMLHKMQQLTKFHDERAPSQQHDPEVPQTPSTCQTQFSSSPLCEGVNFDLKTPCSGSSHRQRFGSGIRRRKMLLGSSEDEELIKIKLDDIESPELSPVRIDNFSDTESHVMQEIEDPSSIQDVSMSFRISCSPKAKCESSINPFTRNHPLAQCNTNSPVAMESSRKQLLLDSPPLSPIEPIKSLNAKKSTVNQIKTPDNRKLKIQYKPFQLCPSPMLSPITGRNTHSDISQKPSRKYLVQGIKEFIGPGSESLTEIECRSSSLCPNNVAQTVCQDEVLSLEEIKENIFPPPVISSSVIMQEDDLAPTSLDYTNEDQTPSIVLDTTSRHDIIGEELLFLKQERKNDSTTSVWKNEISAASSTTAYNAHSTKLIALKEKYNTSIDGELPKITVLPHSALNGNEIKPYINNTEEMCMQMSPRKSFQSGGGNEQVMKTWNVKKTMSDMASNCLMEVSYQQHCAPSMAYSDCDTTANSQNPTECQGDSGYSTAQSNFVTSRIGTQIE